MESLPDRQNPLSAVCWYHREIGRLECSHFLCIRFSIVKNCSPGEVTRNYCRDKDTMCLISVWGAQLESQQFHITAQLLLAWCLFRTHVTHPRKKTKPKKQTPNKTQRSSAHGLQTLRCNPCAWTCTVARTVLWQSGELAGVPGSLRRLKSHSRPWKTIFFLQLGCNTPMAVLTVAAAHSCRAGALSRRRLRLRLPPRRWVQRSGGAGAEVCGWLPSESYAETRRDEPSRAEAASPTAPMRVGREEPLVTPADPSDGRASPARRA